jgi:hypothetical protein
MFCPKCATQNPDGGSFCRGCGANISLVAQALNGQVVPQTQAAPEVTDEACFTTKRGKTITLDQSFKNIFMGIAFLIVAIALSRSIGQGWWFWMLLPAFSMMGTGIAQYIRLKDRERRMVPPPHNRELPQTPYRPVEIPRRNTGELMAPVASVTEGTTRHLGVEAPTRHLEHDR